MPLPQNFQTFSRYRAPESLPEMQPLVKDIYDKLEALQGHAQNIPAQIPTQQAIQATAAAAVASAAGSIIPSATNAILPIVVVKPGSVAQLIDENGANVSAVDGAIVSWNIGGSDTGVVYQYFSSSTTWNYIGGFVSRTQSQLATLAGFLGAQDVGLVVDVTDYAHDLIWTGSAWTYKDPSDPAGRITMFLVDPSPVTGWQLCDGTGAVTYLKADGTTGTVTVPDLTSAANKAAYAKLGSPVTGTANAAVAPGFTGNAQTFTTAPAAAFVAGVQVDAFISPNPYTPTGTVDATGEPRNIVFRPWFRK